MKILLLLIFGICVIFITSLINLTLGYADKYDDIIIQVSSVTSLSVSSNSWTLLNGGNDSGRSGVLIVNPSTNSVNFRFVISTSNVLPIETRDQFTFSLMPLTMIPDSASYPSSNSFSNIYIPINDNLYLWSTSTGASVFPNISITQNVNFQNITKKSIRK